MNLQFLRHIIIIMLEGVWEKIDDNGDQISIGPMRVFLTAEGEIRYKTNTHNRSGATESWQDLAGGLTYIFCYLLGIISTVIQTLLKDRNATHFTVKIYNKRKMRRHSPFENVQNLKT